MAFDIVGKYHVVPGWLPPLFPLFFAANIVYIPLHQHRLRGRSGFSCCGPSHTTEWWRAGGPGLQTKRRMHRLHLMLSLFTVTYLFRYIYEQMVNVLWSGDANGKKGDQVPSMVVLSRFRLLFFNVWVGMVLDASRVLWFMWISWRRVAGNPSRSKA